MGLDMYLRASRYVSGYEFSGEDEKGTYRQLVELFGLGDAVDPDTPSATVSFTVAYWRKANQIHNWFVQNVQGGVDECQESHVERKQLIELRDLCVDLLMARESGAVKAGVAGPMAEAAAEAALEKLPPTSGFFFGSTDIDEWYWREVEDTRDQLNRIFDALPEDGDDDLRGWDFIYQSSW